MSENPAPQGAPETPPAGANPAPSESMIPKARFDEVIAERNELREFRAQQEADAKKRAQAELEAKGKYDEILAAKDEEIAKLRPIADRHEKYLADRRETLLAGLSDEDRALAERLPQDDLGALEAFAARLKPETKPGTTTAKPGSSAPQAGKATPEEIRKNIANPEWRKANKHRIY